METAPSLALPDTFHVQLCTPEGILWRHSVILMVAPALSGDLTLLPGRAPLLAQLKEGTLQLFEKSRQDPPLRIPLTQKMLLEMRENICQIFPTE